MHVSGRGARRLPAHSLTAPGAVIVQQQQRSSIRLLCWSSPLRRPHAPTRGAWISSHSYLSGWRTQPHHHRCGAHTPLPGARGSRLAGGEPQSHHHGTARGRPNQGRVDLAPIRWRTQPHHHRCGAHTPLPGARGSRPAGGEPQSHHPGAAPTRPNQGRVDLAPIRWRDTVPCPNQVARHPEFHTSKHPPGELTLGVTRMCKPNLEGSISSP